jgi:hypothetical protein
VLVPSVVMKNQQLALLLFLADVIWEGDMWEEDFILFSVSM